MPIKLILVIAAIIVAWLVFTWLVKILKTSIKTALSIAAIVLLLQLVFGIGSQELWQEIVNLPQTISNLFKN
jgi:predicted PurR-regulated permease PerM